MRSESKLNVGILMEELNGADLDDNCERWPLFWQASTATAEQLFDNVTIAQIRQIRSNNPGNFARLLTKVSEMKRCVPMHTAR
jgi:hypothetical protein